MSCQLALRPFFLALAVAALASCRSAPGVGPDDVLTAEERGASGLGIGAEANPDHDFDEFEEEFETEAAEVFDPLGGYNRAMYHFNDKFYIWIWRPTAKGYRFVVPTPARVAIDRAYRNFRTPS